MPKGEKFLLKVRTGELARLFKVSKFTLRRWIRDKKLNPDSILDIIDKYLNRWKIDKRMSPPIEENIQIDCDL